MEVASPSPSEGINPALPEEIVMPFPEAVAMKDRLSLPMTHCHQRPWLLQL